MGVLAPMGEAVTKTDAREANSAGLESKTSKNRFIILYQIRSIAQIIPFLLIVQVSFVYMW